MAELNTSGEARCGCGMSWGTGGYPTRIVFCLMHTAAPETLAALELASKYLGKAVADNLMSDCAMPVERAFVRVNRAIAEARGYEA